MNTNKNASTTTVVLIGVIVILLVLLGYFFISQKSKSSLSTLNPVPTPNQTSTSTPSDNKSTSKEKENWKTYRNENYGFEIKYPSNGYSLSTSSCSVGFFDLNFNASDCISIKYQKISACTVNIVIAPVKKEEYNKCSSGKHAQKVIFAGTEAFEYPGSFSEGPYYCIKKNNHYFVIYETIPYRSPHSPPDVPPPPSCPREMYSIISTFRFIEKEKTSIDRKEECAKSEDPTTCYLSLAKELKSPAICEEIKRQSDKILCYTQCLEFFASLKNPALCDKFKEGSKGEVLVGFKEESPVYRKVYYRYECYRKTATVLKNPSICEKIDLLPFRNSCYIKVAFDLKDPSICNNLTEIKLESLKEWPELYYFPRRVEYLNS